MAYYGNSGYYTQMYGVLYKFFRDKKALSADSAITLTEEDLLELGYPNGLGWATSFNWFKTFPIMKTAEDKYWFSIEAYKNHNMNTIVVAFVIIGLFLFVFPLIMILISVLFSVIGLGLRGLR